MNTKNKEIIFLLLYLLIFGALFLLSLYDFHRGETTVNFGFDPNITSIFMLILSFLGVLKTIYHIYRFELNE